MAEERGRTAVAYRNTIATVLTYVLQVAIGFVVRKTFLDTLGVEYLGYNSVFSNVLQMLNLADLGVGVAITSFLYKPLAEGDEGRICALMQIYRRVYRAIGVIVAALGIVLSFFLPLIIPDAQCPDEYLRLLFYINLAGTVATYFLAYKRTLIIADQRSYQAARVDFAAFLVMSALQVLILYTSPDYVAYLVIQVGKAVVANLILSIQCNRQYPFMGEEASEGLVDEYKPKVSKFVRDVFISRVGAVIYYGTDSVVISTIRGSLLVGYLSNYTMVTAQLSSVVTQVLSSVQATFGNYVSSTEDRASQLAMTDNYLCVNYLIGNFCMVCVMLLIQPFVGMVFGRDMMMAPSTAVWLAVNLMLTIMLQLPSQLFTIHKLYRYDRAIVAISASANLIVSIALVNLVGVNGALIGTFVTSLFYIFSRFYIISRKVYSVSLRHYAFRFVRYTLVSATTVFVTWVVSSPLPGLTPLSWAQRAVAVSSLSLIVPTVCLGGTSEMKFVLGKVLPAKLKSLLLGGANGS